MRQTITFFVSSQVLSNFITGRVLTGPRSRRNIQVLLSVRRNTIIIYPDRTHLNITGFGQRCLTDNGVLRPSRPLTTPRNIFHPNRRTVIQTSLMTTSLRRIISLHRPITIRRRLFNSIRQHHTTYISQMLLTLLRTRMVPMTILRLQGQQIVLLSTTRSLTVRTVLRHPRVNHPLNTVDILNFRVNRCL